ncbi:Kininogen-1 [Manis pentadactyla]|nr:Kininogen-1 [Manis pentadactyla]
MACSRLISQKVIVKMVLKAHTYWNQGYGYQQGYGPGYGGSDDSPHGYYGYGPGYYYRASTDLFRTITALCGLDPEFLIFYLLQ